MTRKITQEAVHNFLNGWKYTKSNTFTKSESSFGKWKSELYLHGNLIATLSTVYEGEKEIEKKCLRITNAGWFSTTTKERLNGIPGVSIIQKKGVWYLNGNEWNGSWIAI